MIKIFTGRILDVDTNAPVIAARIYSDNNNGVQTDEAGEFSLMADDGDLGAWFHVDATTKGYGDALQQLGGLSGDIFIYKTSAGAISKLKAATKNYFWGYALTVAAIILILFIAKKYIQ